jgi:hypothetical protein
MKHVVECLSFSPYSRNTLRGFARIRLPALRLTIYDVALHEMNGSRWASLPSRPVMRDGKQITETRTGKPQYTQSLEFEDRATRDAFSEAVWRAVLEKHPEADATAETAP